MTHWAEAKRRGVVFYVSPAGAIRLKNPGLTLEELAVLRRHRAVIAAEWLWECDPPPDPVRWDAAIAEALLVVTVYWLSGVDVTANMIWSVIEDRQAAVDRAWAAQDVPRLITACHEWVFSFYHQGQGEPSRAAS